MILKEGSKGIMVKALQKYLKISIDGYFGPNTKKYVMEFQKNNKLIVDGIVGPKTWNIMGLASTDISELNQPKNIDIKVKFMKDGEYFKGPTNKKYLFLHHTAGWDNPFNTISQWDTDNRGSIGTEFVIGGGSVKGDYYTKHDGVIVQAFPEGGYAWHLGPNGSQYMHTNSVGVELCNFGFVNNGKTYVNGRVDESQIVTLKEPFKGYKTWHKYSDKQIESLNELILYIANRDNINVREGLVQFIKKSGAKGFEFNREAYYGKVKGLLSHSNTNKAKFDIFPQDEIIDMLLSL